MVLIKIPEKRQKNLVALVEQIKEVIYSQEYDISIIEAIGVLEIVKQDLMSDCSRWQN
jgi:hypothetical protein